MSGLSRRLTAFVVGSVVLGLLAAGVTVPAALAAGAAADTGAHTFESLPGDLPAGGLPHSSTVLDAAGHVIARPSSVDRTVVPLRKIAPIMQQAQVAIEDSRFYDHGAVDPRSLARAALSTATGRLQGASTLSQQYAKMLLEDQALAQGDTAAARAAVTQQGSEGLLRKIQDIRYAATLERTETKQQILEGYLDLAYYGAQAYGVEAASERYFSVHASRLTYLQAALLAGLVQQPTAFDPLDHPRAAQARRDVVLVRMAQLGIITRRQMEHGRTVSVHRMLHPRLPESTCAASRRPYECSYVLRWLEQDPALGPDVAARRRAIDTGGLTIRTTFSPDLTSTVRSVLDSRDPVGDPSGVRSAATVVQPGTGRILALGQTTRFTGRHGTQIDYAADASLGGSTYGFQSGSTAKMFVLATAFQQGMSPSSLVDAKAAGPHLVATYTPSENSDDCRDWTTWQVRNDEAWPGGPMTLRQATAQSVNSAFATLTMRVGLCHVLATMTALGLHPGDGSPLPRVPTVALGATTVSPVTMAAAYAAVAAQGVYCDPVPVVSVTDAAGSRLHVRGAGCHRVLSADVAAQVADVLQAPLTDPGGTAYGEGLPGRPAAGKTGTTDGRMQSWFVGFTPQLATAVWVGTPSTPFSMTGVTVGGVTYGGVYGGTIAAPDWHDIMSTASAGQDVEPFPAPPAAAPPPG